MPIPVSPAGYLIDVGVDNFDELQSHVVGYDDPPAMQSFYLSNNNLYMLQIAGATMPLAPGYSDHVSHGDLTLTRYALDSDEGIFTLRDYMHLSGFGHGIAFGVDPGAGVFGLDAIWMECNFQAVSGSSATFGNRICNFSYTGQSSDPSAHTLHSSDVTHMQLVPDPPGQTIAVNSCVLRTNTDTLILRYEYASNPGVGFYQGFTLSALITNPSPPYSPLLPIARDEPLIVSGHDSAGTHTELQGWTFDSNYLYMIDGYGTNNPPNVVSLTSLDLNAAHNAAYIKRSTTEVNPGAVTREPEGIFFDKRGSNYNLCYGIDAQFGTPTNYGTNVWFHNTPAT